MNSLIKYIYTNPNYAKAVEWGKLITMTGSAQTVIQGFSLISGIFVIRFLPTKEYALYTLANTMLGTISVIADGGIATGVMAQGGKVWQNKENFGATIATGLDLRRKFAILVLTFAVPTLLFLLHYHSKSWLMSILLVASLIPTFFSALSGTLLEIAPRLHQDISSLQKIEVGVSASRLLIMCSLLLAFPWAFIAILSAGIPQIWANQRLRKISSIYANWEQKPSLEIRNEILPIVKRILPGALYYCVSGQVTIWLVSLYGSTESLAQVGALGRLVMILSLFSILFSTLIVPRFARLKGNRRIILSRFLQVQLILIIIGVIVTGVIHLFPNQALAVLGRKYSNLQTEIFLMSINSCIGLAAGVSYGLSVAKGWIISPIIHVGGCIVVQLILLYFLNLSTTKNVLLFSIINITVEYLMFILYFGFNISRYKSELGHND